MDMTPAQLAKSEQLRAARDLARVLFVEGYSAAGWVTVCDLLMPALLLEHAGVSQQPGGAREINRSEPRGAAWRRTCRV